MNINVNKLSGNCSWLLKGQKITKNSCFKANLSGADKDEKKTDGFQSVNFTKMSETEEKSRITERIMLKFRSGKKLNNEEMEHLRQASPELYKKIKQMQMDRERLEAALKAAKSQEEADAIYQATMEGVMSSKECAEDKEMRVNQYNDAYFEDRKRRAEGKDGEGEEREEELSVKV